MGGLAWPRKVSLYIQIIGILLHGSYDVGTATAFLTYYHEGVEKNNKEYDVGTATAFLTYYHSIVVSYLKAIATAADPKHRIFNQF